VVTRNPIDTISGHRKNAMETISDIQLAPFLATGDARETISGDQKLTPFLATRNPIETISGHQKCHENYFWSPDLVTRNGFQGISGDKKSN